MPGCTERSAPNAFYCPDHKRGRGLERHVPERVTHLRLLPDPPETLPAADPASRLESWALHVLAAVAMDEAAAAGARVQAARSVLDWAAGKTPSPEIDLEAAQEVLGFIDDSGAARYDPAHG